MNALDLTRFKKKSMVIPCETGIYADAATGKRMVYNTRWRRFEEYAGAEKSRYVKKRTLKEYYTSVFTVEGRNLILHVLKSDEINKHGLNWKEVFQCTLGIFGCENEEGYRSAEYWLMGEGTNELDNDMLVDEMLNITLCKYVKSCKHIDRFTARFGHLPTVEQLAVLFLTKEFEKWTNPAMSILNQRWGLEVEFTGVSRRTAARVLAKVLHSTYEYKGGTYHEHYVEDESGRKWCISRGGSIDPFTLDEFASDLDVYKCELITPICTYEDLPTIRDIINGLKEKGMVVNDSCGIHVHVDETGHTPKSLKNLVMIMANKEELLFRSLEVPAKRTHWCKAVDPFFLEVVDGMSFQSFEQIKLMWYKGETERCHARNDQSRYHALNLHSLWQGKGIEFRLFNGTTDFSRIKAYILLVLAINNQSLNQNRAFTKAKNNTSDRQQMYNWLKQMGMCGIEFEYARTMLLRNLSADTTTNRRTIA